MRSPISKRKSMDLAFRKREHGVNDFGKTEYRFSVQ